MASSEKVSASNGKLHALLVEDNPVDAELVVRELERDGFEVASDVVQSEEEFKQRIAAERYDIVLADYNLPQWCGRDALEILRQEGQDVPVILITGSLGDVKAVECIKQGVTDYVLKDGLVRLPAAVRRALQEKLLRERHKRSDAALRESQAQLETMVQSAMDAIITVDSQRHIILFNGAAERMFRCPEAEALGQPIDRFIPQRFHAAHSAHMQKFRENGTTNRAKGDLGALWALRADGEEFAMEASISRTQVGAQTLFTVIMRDITERERAQKMLAEKMEELARSNLELEQFAYVASHDLQEPLRMVASYTELLGERYRGKLDDKADKYIGYAVDGAKRMQRLINDLLAYARVGSRSKPLQPTDAGAVLASVLAALEETITSSKAEIVWEKLPEVKADELQLGQVLQNLIGNALKFHGERPPRIEVRAESVEKMWRVSVVDHGIGIEKENGKRLFQMFQRLHTREEYEGTGIGLAIAKRIVERHGGRIWFDSVPGEGTTFHFTMPRTESAGGP